MTRRGWTLLELLVVLLLSALLATLVTVVIAGAARAAARQAGALDRERSEAALSWWWRAVLRDAEAGDIAVPSLDRIVAHLPVGAAAPCSQMGSTLWIARSAWGGSRDPEAGRDLVWLLTEPRTAAWDRLAILAVDNDHCPGGEAAFRLSLSAAALPGLLVRVVEPLQLRLYLSGAKGWLGLAPADGSTSVQPFAGPIELAASWFARDSGGVRAFVQSAQGPLLQLVAPVAVP
jgi:prepilin-type N-terminal cleavage/methylation domain-containing protein